MNLTEAMDNVLSIQRQLADETQDPYHIGLYNGMLMICVNHDQKPYFPLQVPRPSSQELRAESTNVEDVRNFHLKFQVPMADQPSFLDPDAHDFRMKFLEEELIELQDAYEAANIAGAADALVDLVYVAMGTALMMGIPWQDIWRAVQEANMAKELAKPDGSNSKRGNPLDVVKPRGWRAPDHWPALGLQPHEDAPEFHATNAVLRLGQRRRDGHETE